MFKKSAPPEGAAGKGDLIEFYVEGSTYTGYVIGVYANSVSVEAEGDQLIMRKKETYKRTVVSHSNYKVLKKI
ncbi:DUF2187 family protein (plasmid) [Rossellomorea sp. AcN35-11]|nr:YkvS family protein [Rossellomorea aquimaris]WJV32208.1 DUF2187 family protein [Rossellomorea sp. AcN35-11]